jgi:hypothetical protein
LHNDPCLIPKNGAKNKVNLFERKESAAPEPGTKAPSKNPQLFEAWNQVCFELMDRTLENGQKEPHWLTPRRFGTVLVVALLAAFPKVLLGFGTFFYRDYGVLGYPFIFYSHESFWRGELPLWNPLSNCGAPFLAQWGTMTLYPFSLFYLIFPLPWSLSYFCFGHLVLGAFGMYFLARRWAGDSFGCGLAGLAYVFNGVTFACLQWPNYAAAMAWMPWVVLWTERSWREGGRRMVVAAIGAAMQILTGVPEIVLFTWLVLGALCCGALFRGEDPRSKVARRVSVVVLLAAGLCAAQLLPFFDLLAHSQRDRSFSNTRWPMPGWGWANILVPLFHCFESFQGPFFQFGQEFLSSYYPGMALLVLALVAAWRSREIRARLLGGLILLAFILALGDDGYLYTWCKKVMPFLSIARYPVKFAILTAFCIPLLAAFAWRNDGGVENNRKVLLTAAGTLLMGICAVLWFSHTYPFPYEQWPVVLKNGIGRGLFLISATALLLSLEAFKDGVADKLKPALLVFGPYHLTRKALLQICLLAVIVGDVMTHNIEQNPVAPVSAMSPGMWRAVNPTPPPEAGAGRVMISPKAESMLLSSAQKGATPDFIAKRRALWSNLNILESIPKVNGSSTLQIKEQKKIEELLYKQTNGMPAGLLSFLGVAQYTSREFAIDFEAQTNSSPWLTVGQEPVFQSAEETLQALFSPGFDPHGTVYLPLEAKPEIHAKAGKAEILSHSFAPERVQIEVEASTPALIVMAQSYHRGWKSFVDGKPVPLWRANYAFQAAEIPAGRHLVEFIYSQPYLLAGGVVSGVTLILCAFLWRSSTKQKSQSRSTGTGVLLEQESAAKDAALPA